MGEIGWVLGVSLLGRVKSGAFLGASLLGNGKSGAFLAYPDGKIWNLPNFARTRVGAQKHTPRNVPRQRFGSKIGCVFGVSLLERVKSGAFLVGTCFGRRGGSGVLTSTNGDRQNASQIRPIFAASN